MKKLTLILLLCVFAFGQAETKPLTPLEQSLIAAEKSIPEAQMKKDSDALKRILADDFSQVSIDGKLRDRDEIIGMMFMLFLGGLDTVSATSSLIFRRLALDPELQQRLADR